MRQKVKRYSRSALSILLTLCMLVSCMTVGIIATDAAKVSADEAVGADGDYKIIGGFSGETWSDSNMIDAGSGNYYYNIYCSNNFYFRVKNSSNTQFGPFSNDYVMDSQSTGYGCETHSSNAFKLSSGSYYKINCNYNSGESKLYVWVDKIVPYLHYCTGSGQPLHDNTATNVAMTHSSGDIYTYNLDAGDYYVNIDGNSGQAGQALGISSVVANSGVTHVQNNAWGGYNFSQIKSDNKMVLSFNVSTKVLTVSPVLTNVKLNAFDGGTATIKQGSTTIAEDETKGLQPGSVATVAVKMDDDTYKTDSFTLSSGATGTVTMKYVGDRTYRGTFTVPETASTVNVTLTAKRAKTGPFTVNYQSSDSSQGTVTASVANGATVMEDTLVTFTATPVKPYEFAGWTGLTDATTAGVTVPVTSNLNVTGNFSKKAYSLVTYANGSGTTGTSSAMTQLSNGYYRSSVKVQNTGNSGQYFTVSRTLGTTTTYAKSGLDEGDKWWITTARPGVSPQHWTSNATVSQKYKDAVGDTNEQHYVFYDPDTNKIWLSTNPDGVTSNIKIYAKDGAMKEANGTDNDTSNWGNTTLTVKVDTTAKTVDSTQYGGRVHLAEIDAAEAVNPKTVITVETSITRENAGDYYVYGYDVNGYTVKAEHDSGNKYKATFSVPSIQSNINGGIEITPIYLLKEPDPRNPTTTRFYVYNFSGDVKSRWGGSLYCYSYDSNGNYNYGDWPGQPMINLGGGTYYIDLPKGSHSVTLSNASADFIHATILGVKLDGNDSWKTRNMYQCQSYDYDDFDYISQKPVVQATDEDIVFDFKYKTEGNNFPDAKGTNEAAFATLYPTLYVSDYTNWETLTNFYGDPVDLWGTEVTANNLNKNPVRVVVQGYHDTHEANKSYYSTAYVVYVPSSETGDANYTIVNYDGTNRYGYKSRSEFLQKTAEQMTELSAYAGRPVQITYEYAIYDQYSTNGGKAGDNQTAERADGVWYYSQSRPVKSEIKIQYADTKNDIFTDDSFANVTPEELDKEGNPYKVNQGTTTHAKAFFTDKNYNDNQAHRPSGTTTPPGVLDVDYDNRVIEWAYTDGNESFDITAQESPDGEYSFLGWYKQSGDHVEFVTADYDYSTEAVRGESFIARYVKSPAGQVKLLHSDVEPGSGGTGIRKVEYDIVDGSDNSVLDDSEEKASTNGAITVPKHYINSNSLYTLKAKFTIESNGNGATNGFYGEEAGGTDNLLTKANFASHNEITESSIQTMTTGITTGTTEVEFSIPIARMFKTNTAGDKEFDDKFSLLEMFSDFLAIPTRDITITKTTDVDDYGTAFKIKIYKGTSASDISTPVTDAIPYTNTAQSQSGTKVSDNGEYTIYKGDVLTLSGIQDGTYVKVVELKKGTNAPDATNLYKFDNTVTCTAQANSANVGTAVTSDNEIGTTFQVNGHPVAVTIDNKIQRETVTITKTTDESTTDTFNIQVFVGSGDTNLIGATGWTVALSDVTAASDHYVFQKDGKITISGVPYGTQFKVLETDGGSTDFKFSQTDSTVTGASKTAIDTEGVYGYTFTTVHADVNAVVHNAKSAPDAYHYRITYTYPSRYQFIPERASRFGDQSYTVEGVLYSSDENFDQYFNIDNNRITKALILDKAPHESNFMMNMTWDKDGDTDANFGEFGVDDTSGTPVVYTGSVRMIDETQSTKNVRFIFPYETTAMHYSGLCGVVYVPTNFDNPVKLPETLATEAFEVNYQGVAYASEIVNNETLYHYTTAPSRFNNGNFLYWSIRAKNVNTGDFEEVARSYNEVFNYTIFDNYEIEPIYDNYTGVGASDEANYKATAKFAKLNLLAITRNQWNNNAKGNENVDYKGEDMVYVDFDLAYAFNDYLLNKNSKTLETGLLIQDCGIVVDDDHPLNLEGNQSDRIRDNAYYAAKALEKEGDNTLKSAIGLKELVMLTEQSCGTSGSKTEPEAGITRYAIGRLLTNKNRYELGVTNVVGTISKDSDNVLTGWNYDSSKKTHVYRAYAYIRNTKIGDNSVILSDPVYFTMKNIAEQ